MSRVLLAGTVALTIVVTTACESATAPERTSSMGGSIAALALAGTWSGTSTDLFGTLQMTWTITQSGRTVTGTVTATTPVGLPVYTSGTLSGTLAANTLSFSVTIPRGAIAEFPDCTASFSGTALDVTATSLTGTYTGTDSCRGAILDGRLTLLRQ